MSYDALGLLERFDDACIRCGLCAQTDCGNFAPGTPCLGDICSSLLSGDETWRHFPFTCALCNRCTVDCPVELKALDICKPARVKLLPEHEEIRPLYRKFRTDLKYNLFSCLDARRRGDIEDVRYIVGEADLGGSADATAFFPGCALYAYAPDMTAKVFEWLREVGETSRMLTFCCGATFFDPGFAPEFEDYKKRVQAFLTDRGIKRLIITCPHCAYELPQLLEGVDVELVKLSQVLGEHGKVSGFDGTISFHDACYDRGDCSFHEHARALYPQASSADMAHSGRNTICCGGGGMVSVYGPAFCEYRRNQRLAEIDDVEADMVLSTCFSCVNSLQRGTADKPVRHFLEDVFDVDIDWPAVYARVNELYADPRYEELCQSQAPALEGE